MSFIHSKDDVLFGTEMWRVGKSLGRLQLSVTVYRHFGRLGRLGDRWVIQPHLIYDRKGARWNIS